MKTSIDERSKIEDVFDLAISKISGLQTGLGFNWSKKDHDDIVVDIMKFLQTTRTSFLREYDLVDFQEEVVDRLEEKILQLGGDIEETRNEIKEQISGRFQHLL